MWKLFCYEVKKNVLRLPLLFLLIGLAAVNIYKVRETVRYEGSDGYTIIMKGKESSFQKVESAFYGEIDAELITRIQEYSDKMDAIITSGKYDTQKPSDEFYTGYAYGDYNVIESIRETVRAAYMYPNSVAEFKQRADRCIEFFSGKNEYEVRKNEFLKTLYNGRKISVYGGYEAAVLYFDYEFSSFVIMIIMIFAFSGTFSYEMLTGTDKIIKSSERAGSVFWAKHLTMYALAASLTIIFSIADILYFGRFYGLGFFDQPMYAIPVYRFAPYNLTIFGVVALSCVFKTLALIFIGEVIMLISSLTKNLGTAMTVSFAAIGAMIFANGYIPELASPFTLFSVDKTLGEFKCVNIFGYPVPEFIATIILTLIYTAVLHIVCCSKTAHKIRLKTEASV